MYPIRIGSLVTAVLLATFVLLLSPPDAYPQPKPPEDTDNVVPVAASVQVLRNVELPLGTARMKVSSIEYAQQGATVYLLPVWVVARVETLSAGQRWEDLPPNQPLPAKAAATVPRLRVHLANLLAQEDTRTAVEKRLREHIAAAEAVKAEVVKLRAPTFNPRGFRITLAAPGTTADAGEVALARTVIVPPAVAEDSSRVIFELLPDNVAALQAANAEPVVLRDTYLKLSGQMKARFEKQQYLANFQAVQTAVTSMQNDLQSIQPTGQPAPEVFVQVPAGGAVEGKAAVLAAFSQHLVGSVSVRAGANVNLGLLNELAERVLGRILAQVELAQTADAKRVAVMLGNLATLSATVGEIKTLARQTKAERERSLKAALDEMEARRTGRQSEYKGSLGVRFGLIGGKVEAAYANASEEEKANRRKQELETLNRGLDELAKHFDGRLPTLTGIRFEQKALDESVKAVQVELQQNSFTVGWSQHDWTGIKLTTTAPAVSPELLLRQVEVAQARFAEFEKLLGTPEKTKELQELLREARSATERAKATAERVAELEKRSTLADLGRRLAGLELGMGVVPHVLKGHTDSAYSVAFSPDGKTLATAGRDDTVRLWDVATGAGRPVLKWNTPLLNKVTFSPDGKTVATSSSDNTARLWDAATGTERAAFKHPQGVYSVAFSPDGKTLATAGHDHTVRLWDVATGNEQAVLKGHTESVFSVAFSPDGKTLATGGYDEKARLWDVTTRTERAVLRGHTRAVEWVAFHPDGSLLATAGNDKTARLWDVATGAAKAEFTGHTGGVASVAFSPDGKTLATGSDDGTARLWDVETRAEKFVHKGHTGDVFSVAFSSNGKILATGSRDRTVRLWVFHR